MNVNDKLKIAINKNDEKTVLALLKEGASPNLKFKVNEKKNFPFFFYFSYLFFQHNRFYFLISFS